MAKPISPESALIGLHFEFNPDLGLYRGEFDRAAGHGFSHQSYILLDLDRRFFPMTRIYFPGENGVDALIRPFSHHIAHWLLQTDNPALITNQCSIFTQLLTVRFHLWLEQLDNYRAWPSGEKAVAGSQKNWEEVAAAFANRGINEYLPTHQNQPHPFLADFPSIFQDEKHERVYLTGYPYGFVTGMLQPDQPPELGLLTRHSNAIANTITNFLASYPAAATISKVS